VFEVQVFCFFQRYKELGIVGVASSICHRQDPWTCVANVKVLILKRAPVDGLAPFPLPPYLTHEIWYDPVKDGVLKAKAFLAGAEGSEVLSSLGNNVGEKLYGDGAERLVISSYFEEHLWVGLSRVLLDSGHLR
uniref:Uncharacterized protein n=1 Tax=Oryzias latipes TaxID=8090 RepID=A0A3P9K3C0_ORYLA